MSRTVYYIITKVFSYEKNNYAYFLKYFFLIKLKKISKKNVQENVLS